MAFRFRPLDPTALPRAAEIAGAAVGAKAADERRADRVHEMTGIGYREAAADRRFGLGQMAEVRRQVSDYLGRRASYDYEMGRNEEQRLQRLNMALSRVDDMERSGGMPKDVADSIRFNIQMESEGITQRLEPKKKNPTIDEWMEGNTRDLPDGRKIAMMPDGTMEVWMPPKTNPDMEAAKLKAQDTAAAAKQAAADRKEKLAADRQQILDNRDNERYLREQEQWREEQREKLHDRALKMVDTNLKQGFDDTMRRWREGFGPLTFEQALERLGGDPYAPKKDAQGQPGAAQPGGPPQPQPPAGPSPLQRPTSPGETGSVLASSTGAVAGPGSGPSISDLARVAIEQFAEPGTRTPASLQQLQSVGLMPPDMSPARYATMPKADFVGTISDAAVAGAPIGTESNPLPIDSEEEAAAMNLDRGTVVIINGRRAVWE